MKLWRDAAPLILPDLNDCPWEMAQSRLLLAAREFYSRSGAWRYSLEPFVTQANVFEYDAVDFNGAEVVRVLSAWHGSDPLEPLDADTRQMEEANPSTSGTPSKIGYENQAIYLYPTPGEGGVAVRVDVMLQPALDATGLQDWMWSEHIEAIVKGAKARLYATQGKPYTDLTMASLMGQEFKDEISRAYWLTSRASGRGRGRVRAHFM